LQLRTKALIVVTAVLALLFVVFYSLAQVIILDGSGDLGARVRLYLLVGFAFGLAIAFGAVFVIEKIGISQVYTMAEAVRRIREEDDLSVRLPVAGRDEVSRFAETINMTLDAVEASRQQVEASELRFRSLVESINDVVWEIDGGMVITYVSPRIRDLMGYEPQELVGRTFHELMKGGRNEQTVAAAAKLLGSNRPFDLLATPVVRRDGAIIDLEVSAVPIVDRAGQVTGYRGVARDVSERKRAGEALKKTYDDLELRVQQRTAELKEANDSLETKVEQRTSELASAVQALQAEVAERKRVEQQMLSSLQEKEVLLKEIHHRVKNNLQIISSLLSLQSEHMSAHDPARAFRESQDRIRSMALIHEKLYQARDISRVDFGEYARSLTAYLSRSYVTRPGIAVSVDIEGIALDIDKAIPCGLIINELVSNALKYAFRDGRDGEVRVALARDGNAFTLTVGDNGAGLPPGLDFRDTPSLGLQLVNTLVSQLEGRIELRDGGTGTEYRITFREKG